MTTPALTMPVVVLMVHLAATLYMTGLIWFVQVVHYPLMGYVGTATYRDYQAAHMARTGPVTAPVMIAEAITALLLVGGVGPQQLSRPLVWLGLAMVVVVWVSTFAVQVPLHGRLIEGFDTATHQRLVATNWLRTVVWSLRALVVLAMVAELVTIPVTDSTQPADHTPTGL